MNQRQSVLQALTEAGDKGLSMDELITEVAALTGNTPTVGSVFVAVAKLRIHDEYTIPLYDGRYRITPD